MGCVPQALRVMQTPSKPPKVKETPRSIPSVPHFACCYQINEDVFRSFVKETGRGGRGGGRGRHGDRNGSRDPPPSDGAVVSVRGGGLSKPYRLVHSPFVIALHQRTTTRTSLFTVSPVGSMFPQILNLRLMVLMKLMIVLLRVLSLLMLTLFLFFTKHLLTFRPLLAILFCECRVLQSRPFMSTMLPHVLFIPSRLLPRTIGNIF